MRSNWYSEDYLLEEKNSFYRKLLNKIPDLIFQLNINHINDFYFSYVNNSIISFLEITQSELKDNPLKIISSRIFPDDLEGFFATLFKSKKSGLPWSYEFRIVLDKKDITWLKVDANVEISKTKDSVFFGRLSDITMIKEREFKVSNSEERFHFAMKASNSGVWDYNVSSGEVYFSKESLAIIQFNLEDNLNTNALWDERIHPEDLDNYIESITSHKENKTTYFENSKRVLAKDGSYRWVLSRGKIIERDKNNKPLRIIGTHTDVTLEKERENHLLGNIDIINAQNNRLLNFAHIVSHNLRSHTGNFKMLLNILDSDDDLVTRDECFSHLKSTSNALSDTIEHLKELVDIHSTIIHKKEKLNLKIYLDSTLNILSKEIKDNNVEIINNVNEKHSTHFNPAYLESLFLNFTTNAIKYSHPSRVPVISFTSIKEKNKLTLLIKDNGLGINLEKFGEKLFGMYKTFHKNPNARGIGLFITKNQIESMGGTIEVESKVNEGSTFKINFNEEV